MQLLIFPVNNITLTMNALNGELSVHLNMEEDTENLPHNLARYARASYSKKVCEILMKYFGITLSSSKNFPWFYSEYNRISPTLIL